MPRRYGKTKIIILLDKCLSRQYLNEDELYIMDIRLLAVINLTAIAKVSKHGNAVALLNANMYHEDMQGNNWDLIGTSNVKL